MHISGIIYSHLFPSQNLSELETNLYSCLRNAIRHGFNISRLAEYVQSRMYDEVGKDKQKVGHVLVVETGGQATISGTGEIFENFKTTGKIEGYSGYGQIPLTFFEKGYRTATVRYMNFDETYHRMPYDCTKSM